MEADCISECDESLDISVEDEEEEEEGSQGEEFNNSSFKKQSQNEEMKSKLSDGMEAVQSEESSLTWETNSSRCSTSHASEASVTSGVYSMENSYTDCSAGKVTFLKEERKTTQEKPSSSTHQTSNEKTEPDSLECDFSQTSVMKKTKESEFDPSDPQSWPSQVQPSKIKDYLVQITQEVTSGPEEKENTLMKKGELPIKGTVRARILQITAVLEERHKKVFRRINNKDMPPPSEVIRKPREPPPKVFSRRGISVSLRHIEQNTAEKNNKKEVPSYNLRHVETKSSKSAFYSKEERKPQHLFLPKTQKQPSEKLPKISTHLEDKAKKPGTKQYSPAIHTSLPELIQPAESDKMEKKEKQHVSPNTSNITEEKSFNFVGEKKEIQDHTPMTFEVSDLLKEVRSPSENQVTQPCSPVPDEPVPYVESGTENQSDSVRTVLSETSIQHVQHPHNNAATHCEPESCNLTEVRTQSMESTIPSRPEVKGTSLGQSVEEAKKQEVSLHSTENTDTNPEVAKLPLFVRKIEKQEEEQLSEKSADKERMTEQFTVLLQTKSDQLPLLSLVQESEAQETESASDLAVMDAEPEVIDLAEIRNQTMDSTIPSGMEISGTSLEFSVAKAKKQEVPFYSTGTKDTIPEKARLPSSVKEEENQEEEELAGQYSEKEQLEDKITAPFETKLNQVPLFGSLDPKSEAHETEPASHLAARHGESEASDFSEVRNQAMDSAIPSEMEVSLEHSVEEAEKEAITLYSIETKDEKARLPSSVKEREEQEEQLAGQYSEKERLQDKLTAPFETKSGQLPWSGCQDHKSEDHETEPVSDLAAIDGEPEVSDISDIRNQAMEFSISSQMEVKGEPLEHSAGEAEKQEVPPYLAKTKHAISEKARLQSPIKEGKKKEEQLAGQYSEKERLQDKLTAPFETKSGQLPWSGCRDHKSEDHETEPVSDLAAIDGEPEVSDISDIRNQAMEFNISSQMEVKGEPLEHSAGEDEKQEVPPYSTKTKHAISEKARLQSPIKEGKKKEEQLAGQYSEKEQLEDKLITPFETKSDQLPLSSCLDHKSEAHETEPASHLAAPEVSDLAEIRNQTMESTVPSEMEAKDAPLEYSFGAEFSFCSTENKSAIPEKSKLPSSVKEAEKEEKEQLVEEYQEKEQLQNKLTTPFERKSEQLPVFECLEHRSKVHESEPTFDLAAMRGESEVGDLAEIRNQTTESAIPSEMEVNSAPLEQSVGETEKQTVPLIETKEATHEKARFPYSIREEQETEQSSDKTKVEDQFTVLFQRKSDYLPLVHKSEVEESDLAPDLASTTQEICNTMEELTGLSESSYALVIEGAAKEEKLKSDLPRQAAQTQPSLTTVSEGKHLRDKIKTQLASTESLCPDPTLSGPNTQEEKARQHSTVPAQSEPEHLVISKSIKAPRGPEEISLRSDKVTEPVSSSEQLLSTPSFLIASVEMHGTHPPSLQTTAPLFEQPDSNIPCLSQQMKKQSNWSDSTELIPVIAEASFATGSKEENPSLSSTEVLAKELVSKSKEPEIGTDTKTGQLFSTVSAQHPGEAPVQIQELNLENQLHSTIKAQSEVEKQAKSSCEINEDQPKQSLESEPREHFIQQNSTVSSQLEGTTALHAVNEMNKEIIQWDKPTIKPLQPDSLHPGFEPPQTDAVQQQTLRHLSQTLLPIDGDTVQLGEEKETNGIQPPLPATKQALSQSVYSTDVQENQDISGTSAKDSEFLSLQLHKADAEHHDGAADPESKDSAKRAVEPINAQLETPSTNEMHFMSELGKHLNASFPISSTEGEGLQMPVSVTAESEDEQPIPAKKDREEMECSAPIIPASKLKGSASETQGNQNDLSKALNEASGSSPLILSFVPDKIKPQAILNESVVSSLPASQQSDAISSELMDKIEIGKNNFPFLECQDVLSDLPFLMTSSIEEVKAKNHSKEPLHSSMATKTVLEEPRSILDYATSEEINEQSPVSAALSAEHVFVESIPSCSVPEKEKQVQPHSIFSEEPMDVALRKANVEDTHSHVLVTSHSETKSQDSKLSPMALQSELEGLTSFNSTEEKPKQETALFSPSTLPQGILYYHEEKEDQKQRTSQTECSKDQDAPLKDDNLLQPVKLEEIQLYCSATLQDSSQLADTNTQEQEDYLPKTEEVDYSAVPILSQLMDDAKKQETHITWSEVAQIEGTPSVLLENEMKPDLHPSFTASLDTKQLDISYSKQPEFYSFEEQNQTSEQEPLISSLFTKKVKEPEENSHPSLVSTSLLSPSNSATPDSDKNQENQPCTIVITKEMPEEPMSIAAFLLSEAKTIETFPTQNSEKENLDTQVPFGDAGLINDSAFLLEKNVMAERKTEFSPTHFESEPQVDRIISTEHLSKAEETKHLPTREDTSKVPENYLSKEKEFKDQEKLREDTLPAPSLDQRKDIVNISESCEVVKTNVPLISSADRKGPILEAVETISLLETKVCNDTRDVVVDKEPSVKKPNKQYTEVLKVDHHEKRENESKELEKGKGIKESTETEEVSVIPESKDDNIFNNANTDYVEKDTLIENTPFTQTEKEKSIQDPERPFDDIDKQYVEATYPAAKSKNILELSSLERELNEAPNGMIEKQNATATHQDISKTANENKVIEVVRDDDESLEREFNLAKTNTVLFNTEKGELPPSPTASLPVTAADSEVPEMPPALAFLCEDEEAVGDSKKDSHKCKEVKGVDLPFHIRDHTPDDGIETHLEKEIPRDHTPNNVEECKNEDILNGQSFKEETLTQPKVIEDAYEPNGKKNESADIQPDLSARVKECLSDTLTNEVTEIGSDIKIRICQPTHAIPFGREFYSSGASNDDSGQRREEESLSDDAEQQVPEETSDEESSPILDYAATIYQTESSGQDGSENDAGYAVIQNQKSEIEEVHGMDEDEVAKTAEKNAQPLEGLGQAERQDEKQLEEAYVLVEPSVQETKVLDHKDLPGLDTEVQKTESGIGENSAQHVTPYDTADQLAAAGKSDNQFGGVDYSLLSHDFDTYPLYSIKEEEGSDVDEDLAELLNYEVVTHDDVFQEEISSEIANEELLFDDKESLDGISDTYEFVNEGENLYTEEKAAESLDLEMLQRNVPEYEFLQKEVDQAHLDTYCYECKCPISSKDKLFEEHKDHDVADLGTAVTVLKGQLNGFLDVLQQRSLKIEGCVGEIEALFNTLEDNCKEKEKLLEEQNENVVKMVFDHHEKKSQNFEEAKNTKMEYLYEQMVNFQGYIDTAKETLEMIIKETEEIDDFAFLKSSEEINKRLLCAVENIVTLEKVPAAFSQFEPCAGSFTNSDRTLQLVPVPHTPKLQPQDPNSATSTSIAVYWTVNEDNLVDFFQVYCMEESLGSKEQSGFVEEYRVIVKESNCILEDLEPGHCYSVWVMAVNYAGCSFPSEKSIFRTAPPTPEIKSEDCTICWDTATIRWSTTNLKATDSFTLEYCRQYSPEGEGLRSLAGIRQPEIKVHLQSNINYFFYVRAVNTFGTSEQSEAALISTKGTRFHIMRELVHPALQVSPNGTMISLPDDANLSGSPPVLGELLPAQGWHYWEVTVSDCGAYKVGICSSTHLESSDLGQRNNSWCLHCSNKTSPAYKVLHNGEMSEIIVTEQPARIGILLNYSTGRLLFLNAERGQLLSAIKYKFTKAAYPAFVLEQSGFLNLHTGMELPEFAKQS